ncbi:F-box protein SKIP31 isoform X4 [Beta vulgaris subsp. vulgaris]|uniref:F-box protein SKIP31 isoform X4 n=1 Tax=Beta vulgaris subsp. vulgaris TaxID=3555 RepID=UPI00053F4C90|nr:F-box protein SKIP31 isoform X4 [Beta vulgaris subsp. vulgaris]
MSNLDEEEENLAQFLESEVLSEVSDQDEDTKEMERPLKMMRSEEVSGVIRNAACVTDGDCGSKVESSSCSSGANKMGGRGIETGILSKIPPELFQHVLKFLSSEDLISCSRVCKFLNYVASDESLWRRLYYIRWGLLPPTKKIRDCAWKKLYIQRDEEDMVQSVTNCQPEFKEYYLQMYAAKRSQAPLLSQANDNLMNLDKTVADQVSIWKSSRGLSDKVVTDHTCSGEYVMIHVKKLSLILQMSYWCVPYLDIALTDFSHRLKWMETLNYSKVLQLMKQSHSWEQAVLHGHICWGITAMMRRNLKMP